MTEIMKKVLVFAASAAASYVVAFVLSSSPALTKKAGEIAAEVAATKK